MWKNEETNNFGFFLSPPKYNLLLLVSCTAQILQNDFKMAKSKTKVINYRMRFSTNAFESYANVGNHEIEIRFYE